MGNKYCIKIGQIELSLEGDSNFIENERSIFFQNILPQVTDSVLKSKANWTNHYSSEISETSPTELLTSNKIDPFNTKLTLNEFLNEKGHITQQDIVLFLVYYAENYNNLEIFSSDDIKQLFKQARLTAPSNVSACIYNGVKQGYFVEDEKNSKKYKLTRTAIDYIKNFQPKEKSDNPKKPKKPRTKNIVESKYKHITKDDLNISDYPDISSYS